MPPKSNRTTKSSKTVSSPQMKRDKLLTRFWRGFIWPQLNSWPTPLKILGSIFMWLIYPLIVCVFLYIYYLSSREVIPWIKRKYQDMTK